MVWRVRRGSASRARSNPPILAGRFDRDVKPSASPRKLHRCVRPGRAASMPTRPLRPQYAAWVARLPRGLGRTALVRCPLRPLSALTRPLCATQAAHGRSSIHPPRVRRHRRGHRFRSVSPPMALRGGRLAAGLPTQAARAIGHREGHAGAPLASAERQASP